jgi:hypothetical protein
MTMIVLALLLSAAAPEAVPAAAPLIEPDPKAMTQKEIRAFNASIDRKHPYYIRCVASTEIGTLSKRTYSCRTNRQWALADKTGNQNARDTVEAMTSKATNTN